MTMRVGSLFTGGGGLDMAVTALWPDAEHVWCSEVDKHASKLLAARMPDVPNLGDITAIDWTQVEPVDVLVGGFPCQDISTAGRRAGIIEGETRSGLWFNFRDAIRTLRPRLVLVENVAAITAVGGGLDVVLGSLAEIGFDAEWGLLRASDIGACHGRARWFALAYDPNGRGGREALEHDGREATPVHGAGVPDEPGRLAHGVGPVRAVKALPTPTAGDGRGARNSTATRYEIPPSGTHAGDTLTDIAYADRWGEYEPAIRQHEQSFGRPAPRPINGHRKLNPAFVEWMMGWPEGWVDLDGLSRANRLKILGNGVVPHQAAAAFGQLLGRVVDARTAAA